MGGSGTYCRRSAIWCRVAESMREFASSAIIFNTMQVRSMRVSARFGLVIMVPSIQLSACDATLAGSNGGDHLKPMDRDQPGFLHVSQPGGGVLDETETQPDDDIQYRLGHVPLNRYHLKTLLLTDYILSESLVPAESGDRVAGSMSGHWHEVSFPGQLSRTATLMGSSS